MAKTSSAPAATCPSFVVRRDSVARQQAVCPAYAALGDDGFPREPSRDVGGWNACADGRVRNGFVATVADLRSY